MQQRFKPVFDYCLQETPNFTRLQSLAINNWEEKIGKMKPSFMPQKGDTLIIFTSCPGVRIYSQDAIKLIEKSALEFPNVFGLALLQLLIEEKKINLFDEMINLPRHLWVLGFDELTRLSFRGEGFGHAVPYLEIRENNDFFHLWHPYNFDIESNEVILTFKKPC